MHDFIFSQKPAYRLLRHSVIWLAWWVFFTVCYYLYQQPLPSGKGERAYVTVGSWIIIKTFLLMVLYAVACYAVVYVLLPQVIKGRWWKVAANTLALGVFLYGAAYYLYWEAFPLVDALFSPYKPNSYYTRFWPAVKIGLIDPLKVFATAAIIKYVKYWWLKQKESERLEREKMNAELQLLKAQIHPNFLFHALNNIYVYSLAASPRTPGLLLKLADLLSYMLYECDQPLVPLEKEVAMMKDYVALEKIRLDDAVEMEISVRGDMTGKMIAPFLLLPFIENSFKQSNSLTEQAWINLDIGTEGDWFCMKLANGTVPGTAMAENELADVKKRLSLIYPQKHELKINGDEEMQMVLLKIQLTEPAPVQWAEKENFFLTLPAIT